MSDILKSFPAEKLSVERETELFASDNRETVILHNVREAFAYGRHCYRESSFEDEEILSAGYEGLVGAAKTFRPGGIRFFAHAKSHIRGALGRRYKALRTVKNASCETLSIVKEARPLEEIINPDVQTIVHLICDPIRPEPSSASNIEMRDRWEDLKPVLRKLDAARRMVLELHYQGGMSFTEIARMLDFTCSNCERLHSTALLKIRRMLMKQGRFSK